MNSFSLGGAQQTAKINVAPTAAPLGSLWWWVHQASQSWLVCVVCLYKKNFFSCTRARLMKREAGGEEACEADLVATGGNGGHR